jgi:hypothetical protein
MRTDCDCNTALPYSVMRWVRSYRPKLRDTITRLLQDRAKSRKTISPQDIFECIGLACEIMGVEIETGVEIPPPELNPVEIGQQSALSPES